MIAVRWGGIVNIKQILKSTESFLTEHNISQPRLDAEVLLADLLDMERIKLYVNFDYPLSQKEIDRYREMILRRAHHYPVAYITGHKEFMSLDFYINENVLVPRPETELLVEEIISICEKREIEAPNIVDVGTGSGVIMVSLGHYLQKARILGVDVLDEALEVARKNISKYDLGERLKVVRGDLLSPLLKRKKDNVDIIVSNPPYISKEEFKDLSPEVKKEPKTALDGGKKGLEIYKKLIPQASHALRSGGFMILEIGYQQAEDIKSLLGGNWQNIVIKKDYGDCDRILIAEKE